MKNVGSHCNRHLKPWDRHCQPSFLYKHHKKHKIVPKCKSKNVWDTNPFQCSELTTMDCVGITRDLCWNSWEEFRCMVNVDARVVLNTHSKWLLFLQRERNHNDFSLAWNYPFTNKWSWMKCPRVVEINLHTFFHDKIPFPCN